MAYSAKLSSDLAIDMGSPVNWNSHLNRDLVSWYLAFPGTCRGSLQFPDLLGKNTCAGGGGTMLPQSMWLDDAKRQGGFGIALDFDGSNDRMEAADSNDLDITPNLTVAAWIRPTASGSNTYRTILAKRVTSAATCNYQIYLSNAAGANQGVLGYYNGVAEFKSSTIPTVNAWSHVAATVQDTAIALYHNGLQVYTGTLSVAPATNTGLFRIGSSGTAFEYFKGRIDDVRVYRRTLGIGEMWCLYQASMHWYPQELRRVRFPVWEHASGTTFEAATAFAVVPNLSFVPSESVSRSVAIPVQSSEAYAAALAYAVSITLAARSTEAHQATFAAQAAITLSAAFTDAPEGVRAQAVAMTLALAAAIDAQAQQSAAAALALGATPAQAQSAAAAMQSALLLAVGVLFVPSTDFGTSTIGRIDLINELFYAADVTAESVIVGGRPMSQANPFEIEVNELTSFHYTGTIVDPTNNNAPVPASSLATLTLTLYNAADGSIINSRNAQNVLNANNVTVSAGGVLVWDSVIIDSPIVDTTLPYWRREAHVARFDFTYPVGDPVKGGKIEVFIYVRNLKKVP